MEVSIYQISHQRTYPYKSNCTYVLLLLIQSVLRFQRCLLPFSFVDLVCSGCAFEIPQRLISNQDDLFYDVVEKNLVVRCEDEGAV